MRSLPPQEPSEKDRSMKMSKDQLKALLSKIVDELPIEEGATELPADAQAVLEHTLRRMIADSLPAAIWVRRQVVCMLQNNSEVVNKSDAVQCANCGRYFCKKHKLIHCPYDGRKL
jgi:hypothetical protein